MQRLSSNVTLIFRIFVPTFWIVFLGILIFVTFFTIHRDSFPLNNIWFRAGLLVYYFSGLVLMYFTCWQWKRVDMDSEYIYVTDYLKASRYPFKDISHVKRSSGFFSFTTVIFLKAPGLFGDKIRFVESGNMLDQLWKDHPQLGIHLNKKGNF